MPRVPDPSGHHIAVPPAEVRAAAIGQLGAEPVRDGTFRVEPPQGAPGNLLLRISPAPDGGTHVRFRLSEPLQVPFFGLVFRPLLAVAYRRRVRHALATLDAAVAGTRLPPPPKGVVGLPPVPFSASQARLLASSAAATAVVSFGGALFGQLNAPISDAFHASDARISGIAAITRAGALIALFVTALADRWGRRRSILLTVVGSAVACAATAVAPNLGVLAGAQIVQRALVIAVITVAGIAVIEEAPEGARAYSASMLALAGGFGFSLAVVVLPFGDLGTHGWRIPFALGAALIVVAPPVARALTETSRYTALTTRLDVTRGRLREVVDERYRRRFVLLGAAAFLTSIFSAPSSTLMNKYLEDVRGFSSTGIAVFRAVTTAVPGLVGLLLGGRLAETRGRRPVAALGLVVATTSQVAFFLLGGPVIWWMSACSILAASAGGIALGTLDAELFATEVRGTSNALLTVVGVAGSVIGLLAAGFLSDPLGHLGRSIALTGAGALAAAFFVIPRLPESAMRRLDEVSPTEPGSEP
jgi:MFS family permease